MYREIILQKKGFYHCYGTALKSIRWKIHKDYSGETIILAY